MRHWTMRFEAKHSYFKQLTHSLGNFINLPYSLASHHQQYQCYLNTSTHKLQNDLDVGPGYYIIIISCFINPLYILHITHTGTVAPITDLLKESIKEISSAFKYVYTHA